MITIKEMAEMLGISTTTVSNVINGKTSEVSQKTAEKVQKLLDEYDYVPNMNEPFQTYRNCIKKAKG